MILNASLSQPDRRTLYRAAKKVLTQRILPRWQGTRASLDRIVRATLRGREKEFLRRLVRVQAFAAVMAALIIASPAGADPIELSSLAVPGNSSGFLMNGEASGDRAGSSVSDAGDVNGDGLGDIIVSAEQADNDPALQIGKCYVVFGKTSGGEFDLADIAAGTGGFAIFGQSAGDYAGHSVSGAGDVNGDGKDDLLVGAPYADPNGSNSGKCYVVFGTSGGASVQLANVAAGTGGFAVHGEANGDQAGFSVSGAGDVNGDGKDDVIIGAFGANGPNGIASGKSYVVFGKTGTATIELSSIVAGTGGFAIFGEVAIDYSGYSVSGGGDVNGDGLADLIVGAKGADVSGAGSNGGKAYVIFGKTGGTTVELSDVSAGTGGFVIIGETAGDLAGYSVSGAGDVNGDGKDDVVVSDIFAGTEPNGNNSGRSYVVFGKSGTTAVNLADIAADTGGFSINGEAAGDSSGTTVSGAGDVDGDGKDDVIVGARFVDGAIFGKTGRAYVVFGKTSGTTVELSDVAADFGGFAINGESALDYAAIASGAGDSNGDGADDLCIGSYQHDITVSGNEGRAYVVFSPFLGDTVWVEFVDTGEQTGTFDDPFPTLAFGVEFVPVGGTIKIKGTGGVVSSSETMTISKKLTLNSVGSNVTIGVP